MAALAEDDLPAKALRKRYEGLVTVRNKGVKGKGAWYWAHLEPILVQNPENGSAKAVKLRCCLCNAMFSASNPSRTASEHLKPGTCPNFSGAISRPSIPPPHMHQHHQTPLLRASSSSGYSRKRNVVALTAIPPPHVLVDAIRSGSDAMRSNSTTPLLLSGGKEDLGALAVLEDNVKKLRSPGMKGVAAVQGLNKVQSEAALNLLAEWLYESCGSVSFACVEHPKFKAFLNQVGLPPVSGKYIAGAKLDAKYMEVKEEADAKLRDALFFQLASDGWKKKKSNTMGESLVNITLNLPNGSSLFYRVVYVNASSLSSKTVEEILEEAITCICNAAPERCVGIVADADKYTAKALQELEFRYRWMVNLSCQAQGFSSLLKDFNKHLALFRSVRSECFKLATFFRNKSPARTYLNQYQRQELDCVKLIRMPPDCQFDDPQFGSVLAMLEDVFQSARPLQLTVLDDSFKVFYGEDPQVREVTDVIVGRMFWSDMEAVLSLVNVVKAMIHDMEVDRPLVSQCLPLWNDLRKKVKDWCVRYAKDEAPLEEVIQKRFLKNYHPAWSAAFILDPLYLVRDNSGRYLPPYNYLNSEQEKDVDRLITRLVARDEAHIALMELMKWRSEGLDPLYAQAVQVKERDPVTGRIKAVNPQSRRLVWETRLNEFKLLGKVAARLIFLHATSCGLKCSWSLWRWAFQNENSRLALERAEKMIYIASHAKLERRNFANEEGKDAELLMDGDVEGIGDEAFINPPL
ncbi:hypothetical protein O6H91_01G009000 [Diphasiastrum complanatum]|uniref:Uncharacterized protein n=1 Tax=Diphasiastrum complanatum TaxID=34168 RepID=A0ACC2EMW0_DIPCM|nr:hypothetical protein O6H91_01G009000 [Diphasiastrum complanatum]